MGWDFFIDTAMDTHREGIPALLHRTTFLKDFFLHG